MEPTSDAVDGRHARRARNRARVVDAMFELLGEDRRPPTAPAVAERAGVSVSSVFRYFDGIEDLERETIEEYFVRFAPLFTIPAADDAPLDERIDIFVAARVDLHETIAPIARMARTRAPEHTRLAETLLATRRRFRQQVDDHFAVDLARHVDGDDVASAIDTLTSFESWDLLHTAHGRDRAAITRTWARALRRLLSPIEPLARVQSSD